MKAARIDVPALGGINERQPQPTDVATEAVNLTVDERTLGWSTRVGYEAYRVDLAAGFTPYSGSGTLGRIDSLFVHQGLPGATRQSILFESGGRLYLQYEAAGSVLLRTIRSDRAIPSASTVPSQYTEVAGGVLVTNGVDAPLFVRTWPFDRLSASLFTNYTLARSFGVPAAPTPFVHRVSPVQQDDPSNRTGSGTSLWNAQHPRSMPTVVADRWGIGFANAATDETRESKYAWQVSFVTDTGSEGPLSTPAILDWDTDGTNRYRYAVMLEVPPGPEGVIARRVYRSTNFGADAAGSTQPQYVFELTNNAETKVIDGYQSSTLGANAPAAVERAQFPAPRARFSAVFGNRCWLDGGTIEPLSLFYSDPGLPEQFGTTSYLRLTGESGPITGLRTFYGMLLVFRESGIDAVVPSEAGGWDVNPLHTSIRCVAPMTADDVPGLGLVFAADDGIYVLTGGLDGGAIAEITRISDIIQDSWARVTRECLPRAVGRYCPRYREYHLYAAADGDDRPNLGFVWHVDKQAWTLREGFPVSALDRLSTGNLVFGGAEPSVEKGLFVISGRRTLGRRAAGGDTFEDGPAPTSRWKSAWLSMTSPQDKKQVQYVTLWVQTTGSVSVVVRVYKDWERTFYSERGYLAQPADAALMPVLDTVVLDSGSQWDRTHAVPIRVAVAHQSCSWFSFEVETTDDLVLVGYSLEFQQRGTVTIEGRRA